MTSRPAGAETADQSVGVVIARYAAVSADADGEVGAALRGLSAVYKVSVSEAEKFREVSVQVSAGNATHVIFAKNGF